MAIQLKQHLLVALLAATLAACGGSSGGDSDTGGNNGGGNNNGGGDNNGGGNNNGGGDNNGGGNNNGGGDNNGGGNDGAPLTVTINNVPLQAFPSAFPAPESPQADSLKAAGPWVAYTAPGNNAGEEILTLAYVTGNGPVAVSFEQGFSITLDTADLHIGRIQFALDANQQGNVAWLAFGIGEVPRQDSHLTDDMLTIMRCEKDTSITCTQVNASMLVSPTNDWAVNQAELGWSIASSPTGHRAAVSYGRNQFSNNSAMITLQTCLFANDTLDCPSRGTPVLPAVWNFNNRQAYMSDAGLAYLVTNSENMSGPKRYAIDLFMRQHSDDRTTHVGSFAFNSDQTVRRYAASGATANVSNWNQDVLRAKLVYAPNANNEGEKGVVPVALLVAQESNIVVNGQSTPVTYLHQCRYAWSAQLSSVFNSWNYECLMITPDYEDEQSGTFAGFGSMPDAEIFFEQAVRNQDITNGTTRLHLGFTGIFKEEDDNNAIVGVTYAPTTAVLELTTRFNHPANVTDAWRGTFSGFTVLNEDTYSRFSHTGNAAAVADKVRLFSIPDSGDHLMLAPSYQEGQGEGVLTAYQRVDSQGTTQHSNVVLHPRAHADGSADAATPDTTPDLSIPVSVLNNGTLVLWSREKDRGTTDVWRYRTYVQPSASGAL